MWHHIHIHSLYTYSVIVFILFSLSSIVLAEHARIKYFSQSRISTIQIKIVLEVMVVLFGFIIGIQIPINFTFVNGFICACLGILIAFVFIKFEMAINRKLYRKQIMKTRTKLATESKPHFSKIKVRNPGLSNSHSSNMIKRGAKQNLNYNRKNLQEDNFKLFWLLITAILEELIYRGFLLGLAMQLPTTVLIVAILSLSIIFGAAHIFLGWHQVLYKTLFAIVLNFFVLLLGSVLVAVIAHLFFNWQAFAMQKKLSKQSKSGEHHDRRIFA